MYDQHYLQQSGQYAVGDDDAFLSVAAHYRVLDEVQRLIAFRVVLRVQVGDVIQRSFRVHDEYRMRYHNSVMIVSDPCDLPPSRRLGILQSPVCRSL